MLVAGIAVPEGSTTACSVPVGDDVSGVGWLSQEKPKSRAPMSSSPVSVFLSIISVYTVLPYADPIGGEVQLCEVLFIGRSQL